MKKLMLLSWMGLAIIGLASAGDKESYFYMGLKSGQSDYSDLIFCGECETERSDFSKVDEKPFAYGVFAGFQWTRYVAAELAYVDMGKAEVSVTPKEVGVPQPSTFSLDVNSRSIETSVKGILPLGERFELFAKAGIHYYRVASKARVSGAGELQSSLKWDDTDLSYGFGSTFKLASQWRLGLAYEIYQGKFDNESLEEDEQDAYNYHLNTLTLNLSYRF